MSNDFLGGFFRGKKNEQMDSLIKSFDSRWNWQILAAIVMTKTSPRLLLTVNGDSVDAKLTTMKTIPVWPGKQINRTVGPSQDIADSQPPNLWRWLYLEESLWRYKWGPQDEMFLDLRWALTPMIGVLIKWEDTWSKDGNVEMVTV